MFSYSFLSTGYMQYISTGSFHPCWWLACTSQSESILWVWEHLSSKHGQFRSTRELKSRNSQWMRKASMKIDNSISLPLSGWRWVLFLHSFSEGTTLIIHDGNLLFNKCFSPVHFHFPTPSLCFLGLPPKWTACIKFLPQSLFLEDPNWSRK